MAIKTLSIPEDLEKFLEENPDLSPSKMLQSKIIEIKENRRLNFEELAKVMKQRNFIERKLQEANEEIDRLKQENAQLVQQKA